MSASPALQLLPFGAIVATCELADVRPTSSFTLGEIETPRTVDRSSDFWWTERQLGDFALGRFGWILANIKPLKTPIAAKGRQCIWNWNEEGM